jgi:RNA polymerase sigma factor (TIGR02999 family)
VPTEITRLLAQAHEGDRAALDRVFELVYGELREVARRQLGGAPRDRTLATTALVHEAYLKLSRGAQRSFVDRQHFYSVAAMAMRQVLVDFARRRVAARRGGEAPRLALDETRARVEAQADEVLEVDRALAELAAIDAGLARLVELRFFVGLSLEEVGAALGLSLATVKRRWREARTLLERAIARAPAGSAEAPPS